LIPKDLDPLKTDIKTNSSLIATANQTITDNKQASDATFLVVNQSITSLDKQVVANTSSITTMGTKLADQQNQITATNNTMNAQIGGLQGQINNTNNTVSNLTGVAEIQSNKSTATNLGGANPSDQAYPSQKAAKAYVDQVVSQIATSGVPDATTLAAGKLQLAGDLGGTATNPTVPALAGKENSSNKSTATDLGAGNPSDQLYPSQKATKAYVDNSIYAAVGTGVPDATTNAAGKLKLAGDLAGTAAIPLVAKIQGSPVSSTTPTTGQVLTYNGTSWAPAAAGSSNKEDVSNKSDAALGTSTTLYPTQNAVKTYVDAQVASATIVDADATTRGKIQLAGDLAGTASSPTVPGLLLKANIISPTFTGTPRAPTPATSDNSTQIATTAFVQNKVNAGTVNDATTSAKGILQLAGDLDGSATSPSVVKLRGTPISSVAPATAGHVLTYDVTGSATWAAPANSANTISGVVPVANGGTGLSSVTNGGAVYASSTSALTTGTLPLTAGGTGVTSQQAAINILTGTQTSGRYLRSDGTDARLSAIQVADVPTLNQNTTGTAANVTGTIALANGGTGLTSVPSNGQILIGNASGYTLATLTAGTGVSITNGAGSITINTSARSWTDQPTVSANQTSFTLTYAPTANSKIWMFINGVRTNNNAYSFSGTTVTYIPASNGAYAITASDRVQFDYTY
jgi:hypothetical protein